MLRDCVGLHECVRRDGLLRPGTGPPRRVRPCRPLSGAALCWDEETLCPHCELIPHVLGGSFSVVPDPISPTTVSIYLLMLGTQRDYISAQGRRYRERVAPPKLLT